MKLKCVLALLVTAAIGLIGLAGYLAWSDGMLNAYLPDALIRHRAAGSAPGRPVQAAPAADGIAVPPAAPTDAAGRAAAASAGPALSAPAAADSGLSAPDGRLAIRHQTAHRLQPDEMIRRWPADSSLSTPLTGGWPKLADFKGRAETDRPLEGAIVFLDYGHGGQDAGAVYPPEAPELLEKTLNLEIGRQVKSRLEAMGATVVTMRDEDVWFSVYARMARTGEYLVAEAKKALLASDAEADTRYLDAFQPIFDRVYALNQDAGGGDLLGGVGQPRQIRLLYDLERQFENAIYLSLHCNSNPWSDTAGGMQVYYYDSAEAVRSANADLAGGLPDSPAQRLYPVYQYYDDAGRRRLADLLYDTVTAEVPALTAREAAPVLPGDYAFLRCTGVNSALVEMGFITNADDRELLSGADGQAALAEQLARAVYRYYCEP